MRNLIAQEKGDDDLWDLKLARGGLTDIDFIAQALILAHAKAHPSLIGLRLEATFEEARRKDLISDEDVRKLIEAHQVFNSVLQWQRLTIEGQFDPSAVSPAILNRLATVAGLPDAKVLLTHLGEMQQEVRRVFKHVLGNNAQLLRY
jgi:glutamate-ammonia-ligase adenylyltransferase